MTSINLVSRLILRSAIYLGRKEIRICPGSILIRKSANWLALPSPRFFTIDQSQKYVERGGKQLHRESYSVHRATLRDQIFKDEIMRFRRSDRLVLIYTGRETIRVVDRTVVIRARIAKWYISDRFPERALPITV